MRTDQQTDPSFPALYALFCFYSVYRFILCSALLLCSDSPGDQENSRMTKNGSVALIGQ